MKTLLSLALFVALLSPSLGKEIIGYDLTGLPTNPTPISVPVSTAPSFIAGASDLTRGPSMGIAGLANSFSSNNFPIDGSTLHEAIEEGRYFEASVTIGSTAVSFQTLDARMRRSGGTFEAQWQFSLDGFASAGVVIGQYAASDISNANDGNAMPTLSLSSIAALQSVRNQTVTFRLYAWGTPASHMTSLAFGRSTQLRSEGGESLGYGLAFGVSR